MDNIFLDTPFKDKDKVKALGARWDPALRKWYVPEGTDLQAFAAWLPAAETASLPAALPTRLVPGRVATDLAVPGRGISLSQLLGGVAQAVSQAFTAGVWTLVEVLDARLRGGHVYVEVSERDAAGTVLATQCRQTAVNFPPGAATVYCNGGYHLASVALMRATGRGFDELMREHVFDPFGLAHTVAPSLAIASAAALPMPCPAAVMRAVFPLRRWLMVR